MGSTCTKHKDEDDASVTPNPTDLAQFADACRADSRLRNFATGLQERTNQVIRTVRDDVNRQSLSFDSLRELTNSQLELNQEVARIIIETQQELTTDEDLFALVEDYFETSDQTLKFCTALEKCLAQARDSQLILQFAVRNFEEEQKGREVDHEGINFPKTLTELEKFKTAGNPFSDEFFGLLKSVSEQQFVLLKKLQKQKRKVDQKLKSSNNWRRVTNVLFVAAFVSALVFSVVAAAVAAPPVVTALAGALTIPIGSIGKWVNSLWDKYRKELKRQKELVGIMGRAIRVSFLEVDSIRVLVDKFEIDIESLMQNAELALVGDEGVELAINAIKGKVAGFMESVDNLRVQNHQCSQEIRMVRTILSQKLIAYSGDK